MDLLKIKVKVEMSGFMSKGVTCIGAPWSKYQL